MKKPSAKRKSTSRTKTKRAEVSSLDRLAAIFGGETEQDSVPSPDLFTPPPLDEPPPALKDSRCRCWDRRLETNERMNPFIYGHDHRCPLYLKVCEDCGQMFGTHVWNCAWWSAHPEQVPF